MNIGEKLKRARLAAELTQETIAERIGVSRQTVSNWENGKSYPDIVSVIFLSDVYDTTLDSLLKGDSEMIKHLKESTDATKSNKQLEITVSASLIVLVVMTLMRIFFPEAPLIDSVAANIIVVAIFIFAFIAMIARATNIKKFLAQKTSNKILVKIGTIVLYGLIYIPLVLLIPETINTDFKIETIWLQAAIRVITACILLIPAFAIHKKLKSWQ